MTRATEQARANVPAPAGAPAAAAPPFVGEVVYMYAFDVAYEMVRSPVTQLLGQPVAQFVVGPSKRSPKHLFFFRPQMVRLPVIEKHGPRGPMRVERTVKLLPVGAISITVRVPFAVESIEDLVAFHDLKFDDGSWLYDDVRALAEQVRRELAPFYVRPVDQLGEEEAYTVFCIQSPLPSPDGTAISVETWMERNRRQIAALLTEETSVEHLSDQEVEESCGTWFSYYHNDVVVIDWDAALLVDEKRYFDEVLYIMELANVQLAEMEAYDRLLDDVIERAYRDLAPPRSKRWQRRRTVAIQRSLREIRIDLARLADELWNISKFFGDWHLARIYAGLSRRFHLPDWHKTIEEKLKTLDELYQLLRADQMNRWMLMLEITIVLLFIVEVAKSIFGK